MSAVNFTFTTCIGPYFIDHGMSDRPRLPAGMWPIGVILSDAHKKLSVFPAGTAAVDGTLVSIRSIHRLSRRDAVSGERTKGN